MKLFTITRQYKSDIYIPESYIDSFSTASYTIRINFNRAVKITGFKKAEFIVLTATLKDIENFKKEIAEEK